MSTRDVLSEADAVGLPPLRAAQVRSFRLLLMIAQQLRYLTDHLYRADGLTTQQAALLSVVRATGKPSLSEAAARLLTSHQNVKQLVNALVAKGFLKVIADPEDARVKRLVTTPKNERHWAARDPDDFERVAEWFEALSASEVTELSQVLATLHGGLKSRVKAVKVSDE